MKKLFLLLTAVLLSAGMVVQAQLSDAVNKSPNGKIIPKADLVSGRNNAPAAIQGAWDYESNSSFNQTFSSCTVAQSDHYSYNQLYILSAEITDTYWLNLGFNVTLSDGKIPAGTYTVTKFSDYDYCDDDGGSNYYMWIKYPVNTCAKSQGIRGSGTGWRITPSYIESNSNTWCIQSGSVTIKHVNNGCGYYVTTSNLKNYNGKSVTFTVGRDDYTYTITTASNNNSWGTVSGGGSKTEGSRVTLTPNAAAGCSFVQWQDGNTDNPRIITVTGNATYTATFKSASPGTITAVPDDAMHGSVTGGGSYAAGAAVTLTPSPLYDYSFIKWSDGNTSNPRTVYVDGNATYTAEFGRVMQINIQNAQCVDATSQNPAWFQYVAEDDDWRVLIAVMSNTFGGSYTESDCALANCKIIDKAENETIMVSTISATTWSTGDGIRRIDANIMGDDGKRYHVVLGAPQSSGADYDNGSDIDLTYTSCSVQTSRPDLYDGSMSFSNSNTRYLKAQKTEGGYTYSLWLEIYTGSGGSIPTGVYPITATNATGNALAQHTINDYYGVPTLIGGTSLTKYNSGWDDIYFWMLRGGSIAIVNTSGTYFAEVNAINTNGKKVHAIIGTKPNFTVTASGDHGTVTLSAPTYASQTTTGTYQYGTRVTLTPIPATGYVFVGWTGTDVSAIREKDGVFSVKVGVKNLNVTPVFVSNATMYTVTINATTNGSLSVKDEGNNELSSGAEVPEGTVLTVTATPATGYHFDSWTNDGAASVTVNGNKTIGATFAPNTYNVSFAAGEGSGTMTNQVFTYGVAQNLKANTFTAPTATVTYNYNGATGNNSPASETVHALFSNWTDGVNNYADEAEVNNLTATNGATVAMTANWSWTEEITLPTPTKTGYTFDHWEYGEAPLFLIAEAGEEFTPDEDVAMTAQWNIVTYNLTYEGLEGATNTNPTTYNVESETITLAAPGERSGYAFIGWTLGGSPITEIATGSTGDKTLTANWNAKLSSITLEDNRENSFYNTFKTTYDGATGLIVTYARQFTQGRWSTLCLPFSVNKAMFNTLNFGSRIYEFKYATGNANDGSGVNLYFSIAKSIEAGKGYIVNADAKLAARTSFTFPGVTINLSADKGDTLGSVAAYNALDGSGATQGNIELVGTLRKGTLKGTAADNRYMGLKDNKIYYPNIATGSTILAYRGIFRSIDGTLNAERIRIIVDGEEKAELEVINGELQDVQETKKFIENGVLYIERNGVIYDATGRKVE